MIDCRTEKKLAIVSTSPLVIEESIFNALPDP